MRKPTPSSIKKHCHKAWADEVKKRDGFRCVICPETEGLEAHHYINPAGSCLATRYIFDNGATLCFNHHMGQYGIHSGCLSTSRALDDAMLAKVPAQRRTQIEGLRHTIVKWGMPDLREILEALREGREPEQIKVLYLGAA